MHKNIIILSLDAFDTNDFERLENTEAFRYFKDNGSYCKRVKSIYPSLTYPAHTTIVTGKLPRNHGIINNTKLQPGYPNPDWYWFRSDVHGETIYDIALKQKKTVASLLFPVTGKSKITYNLPEIYPNRKFQNQITQVARAGTLLYCMDLDRKFGHLRRGINQPELDEFLHESAIYTYEKYNPYLMMVHYVELDYVKHHFGKDSEEYERALKSIEKRLLSWINHLKSKNKLDDTLLVALGDHSHRNVSHMVNPNVLLKKLGLIEERNGKIKSYKAYFKTADGSGYIYINKKYKNDQMLKSILKDNLTVLCAYEENGIKAFIDGEEAGILGADSECAFMIEAAEGYHFGESITGEFIEESELKSTHGFSPDYPDYKTIFMMSGIGVNKTHEAKEMNLQDIAPTLAKLMGSTLSGVDGKVRYDMINSQDFKKEIK